MWEGQLVAFSSWVPEALVEALLAAGAKAVISLEAPTREPRAPDAVAFFLAFYDWLFAGHTILQVGTLQARAFFCLQSCVRHAPVFCVPCRRPDAG
jgi:hypothetical protein